MPFARSGHAKPSPSAVNACAVVPVLALAYSTVIQPLIYFHFPPVPGLQGLMETRTENRIFWPTLAAIAVLVAAKYWPRVGRLTLPPVIVALLAYLAFAGTSIAWSFNPGLSLIRFAQELMVVTAIILPAMLAAREADIMRGVFLCFAFAALVNVLMIPGGYYTFAKYGSEMVNIGYQGYFSGKNLMGECAAITLLLAIYELRYPGYRRILGIIVSAMAIVLLFASSSKTALGLAVVAPVLAGLLLSIRRTFRVSPAIVMFSTALICVLFCKLTGFDTGRISYILTGDSSFTGRATIWFFAETEIARSPFVGWGYQSFWLSGPDAPSVVNAPGWVKLMPNAHNGYYDTLLELGYVGLVFLTIFLLTTLHVIGRVAERNSKRAWLLLSIALFIMLYNFLETLWLRAFDMSWVVFVIVAVEAARHWHPAPLRVPPYGSRPLQSGWKPRFGART